MDAAAALSALGSKDAVGIAAHKRFAEATCHAPISSTPRWVTSCAGANAPARSAKAAHAVRCAGGVQGVRTRSTGWPVIEAMRSKSLST